ncbi:hypothetical protein [Planococcus lenghuensis]|uniref:Uncharacterized protein n=1 Tax=Planococcus lenghuensis TaxID=2213202 RepID=A0A1Q2L0K8_9BACL|nr:hypothetical protein [Planococcus lenghuensis]AQQ53432.1 hypothetical protein B0X71_10330 [Planococcus lenghuensis]
MWKPGTFLPVKPEDPVVQELTETFSQGNNSTWVYCFSVTDQQVFRDGPACSWTALHGLRTAPRKASGWSDYFRIN